jgi:hypothetical protein
MQARKQALPSCAVRSSNQIKRKTPGSTRADFEGTHGECFDFGGCAS